MNIDSLICYAVASIGLLTGSTRADDATALKLEEKAVAASAPTSPAHTAVALAGELAPRRGHPLVSVPSPVTAESERKAVKETLPPLPEGTEELDYRDFFKMPVGDYGLETTDKLKSLSGKRVRVLGYMVKEDHSADEGEETGLVPGRFMLTQAPASVSFPHYGVCDDLPPQTVFVTAPDFAGKEVPYTPRPIFLTGVLSVGNKDEPEGRISVVRLTLDQATAPDTAKQPRETRSSASSNQKPNLNLE